MEFVALSPDISEEWDELVYQSGDGWLYSLSFWQEMITSIAEWGYEDQSFAVIENGRIIGVMPLQRTRDGILVSAAMGTAGPAVRAGIHSGHREKVLRGITAHIKGIADRLGSPKINIALSPLNTSSLNNGRGVNPLVNFGFQDVSTHTRILNLEGSEDELFGKLTQDARRSVRIAKKSGYTVEQGCWSELLDEYYRIHSQTYHRTGVTPHPRAYFEGIASRVAPRKHSFLWVGRNSVGAPIAFHNCARFGRTSLYWTGCCESKYLESGINYLLFWHALLEAKKDGCLWYEIGEVFPNVIEGKLHGLTTFKNKFGGDLHRFCKGEMNCRKRPVLDWLKQAELLLLPVVGERITGAIASGASLAYRSSAKVVDVWQRKK